MPPPVDVDSPPPVDVLRFRGQTFMPEGNDLVMTTSYLLGDHGEGLTSGGDEKVRRHAGAPPLRQQKAGPLWRAGLSSDCPRTP